MDNLLKNNGHVQNLRAGGVQKSFLGRTLYVDVIHKQLLNLTTIVSGWFVSQNWNFLMMLAQGFVGRKAQHNRFHGCAHILSR